MAKKARPSLLDSLGDTSAAEVVSNKTPVVDFPAQTEAPNTPQKPKSNVVKSSVYLPPMVHRKLKEIAFAKDCKIHDLIMEGLDHVLTSHGHPSVEELRD